MPQIRIRPYQESDASLLYAASVESMKEVGPWLPWCHPDYQLVESEVWIRSQVEAFKAGTEFQFAVETSEGAYLGGCGLNQISKIHQFANLGYWIRSTATRRGVASEAVRLLADWAFAETSLVRLELVVAEGNRASQRVAEKAGATREGHLRKRLHLDGVWHDAAVFSITRADAPGPRG